MKLLSQGSRLSNSPFRRRHPTSEEIVEEVYRRVQEQQQQLLLLQQEANPKSRSTRVDSVTKISPPTSNSSANSSATKSSLSSHSPESRTDRKVGGRTMTPTKNDSRQKTRSITPFGRRRNITVVDKPSSLDVTQLVAEYTSHNPGRVILDSRSSREQSTTFLPVEVKVDDEIRCSKDKRPTSRSQASAWASIRRKKSLESADSTLLHRNTSRRQHQSSGSSSSANPTNAPNRKHQENRSRRREGGLEEKVMASPGQDKASPRHTRSMSPFFRRRNKPASVLIAEAEKNAMELSRLNEQPSTAMRFCRDRSLSGIDGVKTIQAKPLASVLPSPVTPPRRARSLSPFTRRKCAHEVISDVYRKMEIDYSNSTTGSSNSENGVEIVLAGIATPGSPNLSFLRKRTPLPSPTAINVLCRNSSNKHQNDEDETHGLQTIATVLFKDPPINKKKKEDHGLRRSEKAIRGRKSLLLSKTSPEISPTKRDSPTNVNIQKAITSMDVNVKASAIDKEKKKRGLIQTWKSNGIPMQADTNCSTTKEPQSPTPKLRLDLVPPSSIAVGGRSRVSELSVPNIAKSRTAIPLSSRAKTRSLGERSLAEIQSALEKVQKELTGATKAGQTIPRDLVMEKLLAVADTIEAPDDRKNFLRKLSRLGSTTLSHSSGGGTTTDYSDSSDDEETSTDRGDTSGDESSFAQWTVNRDSRKQASVGQWTMMLEALGLHGFWDDDTDVDDLDMSHESLDGNDDDGDTDEATIDRTATPTPPITPMINFTGFIGQIASMGSLRDDKINEPKKADNTAPLPVEHKVHVKDDSQKRIAIADEERMLRELEEMDRKIQTERLIQRKTQATERLKTIAANLQKEKELLDRKKTEKHDAIDVDAPENVIEMYVQDMSAEGKRVIAEEKRLRRVIEEEIMKQKLVDTVLNKVQQEKLLNFNKNSAPANVTNEAGVSIGTIKNNHPTSNKLGASSVTKTLADSATQLSQPQQFSKSHTRSTLGSARSRFTGAASLKRSFLGGRSQSTQRDQISTSDAGTTLGSASLISQPQMTLSTITSNTGYTYGTRASQQHLSHTPSLLNDNNKNNGTQGSTANDLFSSMSLMSDDKETYYANQSIEQETRTQPPQPSVSSKTRRSWIRKQSQQNEPPVRHNSICESKFDMNCDSYDDALSVGSIESHQFDNGCQYSVATGQDTEQTSQML